MPSVQSEAARIVRNRPAPNEVQARMRLMRSTRIVLHRITDAARPYTEHPAAERYRPARLECADTRRSGSNESRVSYPAIPPSCRAPVWR
jgi:hypothetical protein